MHLSSREWEWEDLLVAVYVCSREALMVAANDLHSGLMLLLKHINGILFDWVNELFNQLKMLLQKMKRLLKCLFSICVYHGIFYCIISTFKAVLTHMQCQTKSLCISHEPKMHWAGMQGPLVLSLVFWILCVEANFQGPSSALLKWK